METKEMTFAARKVREILRKRIEDTMAEGRSAESALRRVAARYGFDYEWTRAMMSGSKPAAGADIIDRICKTDDLDVKIFFKPKS